MRSTPYQSIQMRGVRCHGPHLSADLSHQHVARVGAALRLQQQHITRVRSESLESTVPTCRGLRQTLSCRRQQPAVTFWPSSSFR